MPTKDSGKPPSRKRTSRAGTGAESAGRARGTRQRKAAAGEQPSPTPDTTGSLESSTRPAPRRAARQPTTPAAPVEPMAQATRGRQPRGTGEPTTLPAVVEPVAESLASEPIITAEQASAPQAAVGEPPLAEEAEEEGAEREPQPGHETSLGEEVPDEDSPRRRGGRGAGTNALGVFIERQFANPNSPCHSYSDLERHSNISREALSRYVTARADRRRSPTIDTLVAIADALHVGLEAVARAAGASVRGIIPPPEEVQHARESALGALVAALSDEQFSAVVELLRQMRPPIG